MAPAPRTVGADHALAIVGRFRFAEGLSSAGEVLAESRRRAQAIVHRVVARVVEFRGAPGGFAIFPSCSRVSSPSLLDSRASSSYGRICVRKAIAVVGLWCGFFTRQVIDVVGPTRLGAQAVRARPVDLDGADEQQVRVAGHPEWQQANHARHLQRPIHRVHQPHVVVGCQAPHRVRRRRPRRHRCRSARRPAGCATRPSGAGRHASGCSRGAAPVYRRAAG